MRFEFHAGHGLARGHVDAALTLLDVRGFRLRRWRQGLRLLQQMRRRQAKPAGSGKFHTRMVDKIRETQPYGQALFGKAKKRNGDRARTGRRPR